MHHEEIDDDEGTEHIEQRLDALKKSEAHIFLLYSTANAARKIFQVFFLTHMNVGFKNIKRNTGKYLLFPSKVKIQFG